MFCLAVSLVLWGCGAFAFTQVRDGCFRLIVVISHHLYSHPLFYCYFQSDSEAFERCFCMHSTSSSLFLLCFEWFTELL